MNRTRTHAGHTGGHRACSTAGHSNSMEGTEHGAWECSWDPHALRCPCRDTQVAKCVRCSQMLGLDFLCLASQEHHAVALEYE